MLHKLLVEHIVLPLIQEICLLAARTNLLGVFVAENLTFKAIYILTIISHSSNVYSQIFRKNSTAQPNLRTRNKSTIK